MQLVFRTKICESLTLLMAAIQENVSMDADGVETANVENRPGRMALSKLNNLFVSGLMLLVVFALWLPFGFIIPHHEPWWLHSGYEAGQIPSVTLTGVRSLHFVVPWLAYKLAPDSFMGYHALMIFGFWAKGFLLYLILSKIIPHKPSIAIASGVLLIIFPADSAIFIQQATLHHIALLLLLLSVYLFLLIREHTHPLLFAGMIVCQWASISIYEAGLPLMFAVAFLPLLLERKLTRRVVLLGFSWIIVPIFWTIIIVRVFLGPVTDQGYIGQVAQPVLSSENLLGSMLNSLWKVYPNHFISPWLNTVESIGRVNPNFLLVAFLTALIVAASLLLAVRSNRAIAPQAKAKWQIVGLLGAGLVMIALGFVMYLPTELQNSTIRTYFYTAVGASISVVSFCYLFSQLIGRRFVYIVFIPIVAALTFVAFIHDLAQHDVLAQYSSRLQHFLTNVIKTVPAVDEGTYLYLIGDETVQAQDVLIAEANEGNILAYLYQDYTMRATSGYFNKACINIANPSPDQFATCVPGENGIVAADPFGELTIPYSQVVAIQFDRDGNTTLLETFPAAFTDFPALQDYQPESHIQRDQPYPLHARTVLGM